MTNEEIQTVSRECKKLPSWEKLVCKKFGPNRDLTVVITKDTDFEPLADGNLWNIVCLTVKREDGSVVADTGDIHVDSIEDALLFIDKEGIPEACYCLE